ncbi:MAG: hypothetical protein HY906_13005 [Deltaproteobacteria bacterium]|nr:hypothetical protein [Deltaproteobacteria bacterium]
MPDRARTCPACLRELPPRPGLAYQVCPHCKAPLTRDAQQGFDGGWDAALEAKPAPAPARTRLGIAQEELKDLLTPEEGARLEASRRAAPAAPPPALAETTAAAAPPPALAETTAAAAPAPRLCPSCGARFIVRTGMALQLCPACMSPLSAEAQREVETAVAAAPVVAAEAAAPAQTRRGIAQEELKDLLTPGEPSRPGEAPPAAAIPAGAASVPAAVVAPDEPPPPAARAVPAETPPPATAPRPAPATMRAVKPVETIPAPAADREPGARSRAAWLATVVVCYLAAALAVALALYRLLG